MFPKNYRINGWKLKPKVQTNKQNQTNLAMHKIDENVLIEFEIRKNALKNTNKDIGSYKNVQMKIETEPTSKIMMLS